MSKDSANRGKSAESMVQAYLAAYSSKVQSFDWERRYDAHSAGGRFGRQTYDFAWFRPGEHGGIEVKEVAHDFRLPHKNLEAHQLAKLRVRELAGGMACVLVYHTTTKLWRVVVNLDWFLAKTGGSWDLSSFQTYTTCQLALESTTGTGFTPLRDR